MSEISRRRLVRGAFGSVAALYGNSLLRSDSGVKPSVSLPALKESLQPYTDVPRSSSAPIDTYPEHAQVIVASNKRIHQLPRAGAAFVIVHSGFISSQLSEVRENVNTIHASKDPGLTTINRLARNGFGSVEAHNGRMARLISVLDSSACTTLSYVEAPDLYYSQTPRSELAPPINALQVCTRSQSGELESRVSYMEQNRTIATASQRPDIVFSSLRQAGIEEIYVSGEYTFNPWSKEPACLGAVALSYLEEGFRVRGIQNAVFPPALQEGISRHDPLAKAVYADDIPYDQALQVAQQL